MSLSDDRTNTSCILSSDVVPLSEVRNNFSKRARSEVKSTASIDSQHREGSGGRSLFRVTRNFESCSTDRVRSIEKESLNLRRVAVIVNDDRNAGWEQRIEGSFVQRVRMIANLKFQIVRSRSRSAERA